MVATFRAAEARLAGKTLPARSLVSERVEAPTPSFACADSDGCWALVIQTRKSQRPIPALKLSSLSVEYGANYQLHGNDDVKALRVCVVRCTSLEPAIQLLFASYCLAMLQELSAEPSDSDVDSAVNGWVSLFWKLHSPPRTTAVGLIGELALLDAVRHTSDWVRAWHSEPTDNLDFVFSTPRLSVEVKATTSQQRVHELSIHQAVPVINDRHYFASVVVELRESGVRLGDVVEEITSRLAGPTEVDEFWRALVGVCGNSLAEYFEIRFMRDVARASLKFYEASAIPQPLVSFPLPAGVSGIRFRSDFSAVEPVDPAPLLSVAAEP
jgi:hypothetical protein